jgi:hypothetical protein
MLSALEFWNVERKNAFEQAENVIAQHGVNSVEAYPVAFKLQNFDHWSQADWMDFAERYADYVCTFEKRDDYQNALTEEQHVRELSI